MAFPVDWLRKQKITIAAAEIDATLTDQVVLITLDHLDTEIVDGGSAQGTVDAIRFGNIDGTVQYAHEIQRFTSHATAGNRRCMIWVKVPSLSSSVDTDIYIFYQNVAASEQAVTDTYGRNAVWSNFDLVYHLNETSNTGPWVDATGGSHNGTLIVGSSLPNDETNHPFDESWPDFSDDHVIELANTTTTLNSITNLGLSCWYYPNVNSGSNGVWSNSRASDTNFALIRANGRVTVKATTADDTVGTSLSTGNFHLATLAYDGGTSLKSFADGALTYTDTGNDSPSGIVSADEFIIGALYDESTPYRFDGRVAECRAFSYTPTIEQHAAEWSNINTPATFASAGTPESAVTNSAPTGSVVITGTTTENATLTATDTLADEDGLGTFSYQWKRDGANISGATSSTYVLTEFDVSTDITVTISYTDLLGTPESSTSAAVGPIAAASAASYQQCYYPLVIDPAYVIGASPFTNIVIDIPWADIPTAFKDGGSSSAVNGGGNIRVYQTTDFVDLNRLALKVVGFDINAGTGTLKVVVPTLSNTLGKTLYIVKGDPTDVQPATSDTYGSDIVDTYDIVPADPSDLKDTLDHNDSTADFAVAGTMVCSTVNLGIFRNTRRRGVKSRSRRSTA